MEYASILAPEAAWELMPSLGLVMRLGPVVGRAGKQQQHLWDMGEPAEDWLRGSQPPSLPSLWGFFSILHIIKGLRLSPGSPGLRFLILLFFRGHSRSCNTWAEGVACLVKRTVVNKGVLLPTSSGEECRHPTSRAHPRHCGHSLALQLGSLRRCTDREDR